MRFQLATLLCALTCCAFLYFGGEKRVASIIPSGPTIKQSATVLVERELSLPEYTNIRASIPIAAVLAVASPSSCGPPPVDTSRGWLQVQVTLPATSSAHVRFGLEVRRGDKHESIASREFRESSFEIELAPGEYTVTVSDTGYPWHWHREFCRGGQPKSANLFMHQETVRIEANRNTLVFVNPELGGRFWFEATTTRLSEGVERLREEATISSRKPRSRGCRFPPEWYGTPTLRDVESGQQHELVWSLADVMNITGSLRHDRGYLMQNVLPAGEYELTFLYDDSKRSTIQFRIENGKTTGVVLPCELF